MSKASLPKLESPSCNEGGPHKIFLWDPNGVYLDCGFPNPQFGHFLNPQRLIGACVLDLFPRTVGRRLEKTIHAALKAKGPRVTQLEFERDDQHYVATVTCVPTQEGQVIGFVKDRLMGPQGLDRDSALPVDQDESSLVISLQQTSVKKYRPSLTPQEVNVLTAMGFYGTRGHVLEGHSPPRITNEEIAQQLHLSVRTVKFHLTNIYRKLQITSRYHLFPSS